MPLLQHLRGSNVNEDRDPGERLAKIRYQLDHLIARMGEDVDRLRELTEELVAETNGRPHPGGRG